MKILLGIILLLSGIKFTFDFLRPRERKILTPKEQGKESCNRRC
ncbi:MAG: hypothetical protein ABH956_00355 [Candidatus Nealsonbacteria bacterium]